MKKLAKKLDVDEADFKTAQIYDFENGSDLIPTIDKYSRYALKDEGKWYLKTYRTSANPFLVF